MTSGVLHVSARAASCDDGDAEFPACHVHQQDWGVPVEVDAAGASELTLPARRPLTGHATTCEPGAYDARDYTLR